jgi:UDP-glucose 4-epimerase
MATVVVTGASGLIGQAVIRQLCVDHTVFAVSRRYIRDIPAADVIIADLTDPAYVERLPRRADAVVHLAQATRYYEFPEAADEILAINVVALARLLDWARTAGVVTFVHTSTGGLYGRSAHPFNEAAPLRIEGPLSYYFGTKRCAELVAEAYSRFFTIVTLRPFFVYGAGQRPHMLMSRLIASIRDGRPIRLAGPEGVRLNPLHVSDMANAVEYVLRIKRDTIVNIAGPEVLSVRDIAEALASVIGRSPVYEIAGEMADADIIGDTSRLRALGWAPKTLLREVAAELCDRAFAEQL